MSRVDIDRIIAYEKAGKIRVQSHPELPLFIANYTEQVQFKRQWDDLTLMCRGLIFDRDGEIVARPFKKFFNMGEGFEPEKPAPLPPDEPFEVTEKMDGSLGILYWAGGEPFIASRGSFTSEQAQRGTAILRRILPPDAYYRLKRRATYLFEIVYPENRIVVDYGGREDLVLLAVINNETGEDLRQPAPHEGPFTVVRRLGPYRSLHDFVEDLPTQSARDDIRQRVRDSQGSSSVSGLHEGEPRPQPERQSAPAVAAGAVCRDSCTDCRGQEQAVHGLQEDVSDLRDGLRPPTGGDQAVQHLVGPTEPHGAALRDCEVRCGVCELPQATDLEEGYVLHFESGLRLKLKFSEYLRLHKLVTGINNRRIWEVLAAGQSIEPFLERVPDEFYQWVDTVATDLHAQHETICDEAHRVFERIRREAAHKVGIHDASLAGSLAMGRELRKEFALLTQPHPRISGLLFTLLDHGDIKPLVWKMIRPEEAETPYAPAREV